MVTASRDWAVTWAVIELWHSRDRCDWAVTSPWLSCDLAVTELWPRRDWAVTKPSRDWAVIIGPRSRDHRGHRELTMTIFFSWDGFRDLHSTKSGPNLCQIWHVFGPWASPNVANGRMTMTVHNYRSRQFHRTSNGKPSSDYRDMGSAGLAAACQPARTVTTFSLPAQTAEG